MRERQMSEQQQSPSKTLGIVGVRGYVGKELLTLVASHPHIDVSWVSSRQLEGQSSKVLLPQLNDFTIENLDPAQVADKNTDIVVLALPNGLAAPYVEALEAANRCQLILDLSADYRFDDSWTYSLPELDQPSAVSKGQMAKISNPGCYATAMQLALAPIQHQVIGRANCFGVSGFSGAGTKPSPNNDPDNLKDNLIGYGLIEHMHEKEVCSRLQNPVSFSPHVAQFFRGINMTVQVELAEKTTAEQLHSLFTDFYAEHPLVKIDSKIPTVSQVVNTPDCLIGGFAVSSDGKRATIISCVDNLSKGAASQALQNINLVLGYESTLALLPTMAITEHQIPGASA